MGVVELASPVERGSPRMAGILAYLPIARHVRVRHNQPSAFLPHTIIVITVLQTKK